MGGKYYRERENASLLIGTVVLFWGIYIINNCLLIGEEKNDSFNMNFVIYAIITVLFFFAYGISFLAGRYVYPFIIKRKYDFLKYILPCGTILFIGIWLMQIYLNENMLFPKDSATHLRHDVPVLYACATVICSVLFVHVLLKGRADRRISIRILFAILIAFAGAILLFAPTLHRGDLNAFFNSIYETLNGYPYTSIYGHYAILYAIPIKILGGSILDIYRVIAVIGFITFVAIFAALANVIRYECVYYLTCIAIIGRYVIYSGGENYYQMIPHRWLFPGLFIFLWSFKKNGKTMEIVSYVLLVFSIIWNLDSGFVLLIAYSGYRIYEHIREKQWKRLLFSILWRIFWGLGCFLAAYGIVGIYNIFMGGKWGTIEDFIYPYFSEGYHIADLMVKLPGTEAVYGILIACMLGMISVSTCRLLLKRADWIDGIKFFVALIGSGMMFYYMNRAAYGNIACSSMECTFLLGVFVDETMEEFHINRLQHKRIQKEGGTFLSCYILSIFILLFMSSYVVETVFYYGEFFHEKIEKWDLSERNDFVDEVERNVPKDTFAFGASIPELYYQLDWDTGCHVMDWADLNDKCKQYIQKRIKTGESFLAEEGAILKILPDGYYPKCEKTFIYAGSVYYYASLQYIPKLGRELASAAVFYGISDEGWLGQMSQFAIQSGEKGKIIQYDAKKGGVIRIGTNMNGTTDYEYSSGSGEIEVSVYPDEEVKIYMFLPFESVDENGITGVRITGARGI